MSDWFSGAPEQQSIIKTELVKKYFGAWSAIMLQHMRGQAPRIAYIDLFAGPGRFANGTDSTPLVVLSQAVNSERLRTHLVTMFNDSNSEYAGQLQAAIDALPGIESLRYKPEVVNTEVGSEMVDMLRSVRIVPTLFFIDPWGYKGLSLDLIGSAIKDWGCDCIFFFNYNRIQSAFQNPLVSGPINDLFGHRRAEELRKRWNELSSGERQREIMREFAQAVREIGGRYVLPFGMRSQHAERTSHYIIFVSKHPLGYKIMKDIMYGLSSDDNEVRAFEYVPTRSTQLRLFDPESPYSIPALKEFLLDVCAGSTLRVDDAYERYALETQYLLQHVKKALRELESEGQITIDPPAEKRKKGTLGGDKTVTFPAKKGLPDGPAFNDRVD